MRESPPRGAHLRALACDPPGEPHRRAIAFAAWLAVGLVLAGCGSTSDLRAQVIKHAARTANACPPGGERLVSQLAGPDVSGYTASFRDLASNQARCELRAGVIGVTLALDSSPQPYQRLEREIVEDGQQFGTVREFSPPQAVSGVGLDAAWIPDQSRLITADSHRLVTVTVTWPGSGSARRRGLARALALSTLGP